MRALLFASIGAAALAAIVLPPASRADSVTYVYAALPGPASNCVWFDENLNDRSTGALARQIDLLYNRAGLIAGTPLAANAPVVRSGGATTTAGDPIATFTYAGRVLCAQAEAVSPPTPTPLPVSTPTP